MLKETVQWCKATKATKYSACVDLYSKEDIVIGAGCTVIINLGVKIDLSYIDDMLNGDNYPLGACEEAFKSTHYLELHPRSGLRAKGLIIGVGVIDLDYPDELGLIVHNPWGIIPISFLPFNRPYTIKKGDKIAQCTLVEHKGYLMGIESEVERTGGFGSTN